MNLVNCSGLCIFFGAGGVGSLVQGLTTGNWETDAGVGLLVAGPLALAVDLVYRAARFHAEGRWRFFKPTTGAHAVFIPMWVFGLVWIFVGIHAVATGRGSQVAEHNRFLSGTASFLEETVEFLEHINTRAAWEAAQERVERCRQRLSELGPFYRSLSEKERERLQGKYGKRIQEAADSLQLQAARLNLLPERRQGGVERAP
jgi:hypothetical protein